MAKKKPKYNDNNLAIAYYRYSSHAQNETSIDQQREAAQRYAEAHGLTVVREYEDAAISGTEENRPGFQLMLSEINKIKPAALVLWKTDRLGRDRYVLVLAKKKIRDAGVRIHLVAESIPQDSPESVLLESLMEGMADFYIGQLRENVTRGLRHNAELCLYNGRKILGYTGTKGERYEVDEATAPVVRRIFRDYCRGIGMQTIADSLNKEGLRTSRGAPFTVNSLRWILKNEAYIGVYRFGDIRVEGGMPAIISKEDYEKAQKRIADNKRRNAAPILAGELPESERYWLQGKLYCGMCGEAMQGVSGTSKSGATHRYYYCRGHREHRCNKSNVRKDVIEAAVVWALYTLLGDQGNVASLAVDAAAYYQEHYAGTGYLDGLREQLAQTERGIRNFVRAIEAGILTESTQERLEQLEEQRKALIETIEVETVKSKILEDDHSIAAYFERYMEANLDDPRVRADVMEYFVDKIFVFDDRIDILVHYTESGLSVEWGIFKDGEISFSSFPNPDPPVGGVRSGCGLLHLTANSRTPEKSLQIGFFREFVVVRCKL